MRFKTDENLPLAAAELLRSQGWDAESVSEEGLSGTKDPDLMRRCVKEARTLITLDWGFADIRTYPPSRHPGIMVLRPISQGKAQVVALLTRIIPLLATEPISGTLWLVDDKKLRIRKG